MWNGRPSTRIESVSVDLTRWWPPGARWWRVEREDTTTEVMVYGVRILLLGALTSNVYSRLK